MDYNLLFAEAWPVSLYPCRFRSDEARLRVMARIAGILVDLEAAVRRELGAERHDHSSSFMAAAPLLSAATSNVCPVEDREAGGSEPR